MPLLEIKNLTLDFVLGGTNLRAVDDVSFSLNGGETLCLVGESGCGKSITALSIGRLVPSPPAKYSGGEILLNESDVLKMSNRDLRDIRGGIVSYVFQEPGASLNPVFRVGRQIKESLKIHRPEKATDAEVIRLLKLVGIPAPESRLRDYPFQMSGGMQQRVMVAMVLASEPKLVVADEPTTALDVTIQAQILDLLCELEQRLGMAILLITHNLGIVGDIGERVAVMYAGQIVELGPARELLQRPLHPYTQALLNSVPKLSSNATRLLAIPGNVPRPGNFPPGCRFYLRSPKHPYTQALVSAVPVVDPESKRERIALSGDVPSPIRPPRGCAFHPRCPVAEFPLCQEAVPPLREIVPGHWAACHLAK